MHADIDLQFQSQNELPLLCEWDKHCIQQLGSEFEIDFINLSYTRSAEDVIEARRCGYIAD